MSATFTLHLDDAAAQAAFEQMRLRGLDLRPALRAIGRASVAQTRRRFLAGRAPDGSAWKPGYKTRGKTLIGKGLLLRSITATEPTATSVDVGSNRIYAGVHQRGAVIKAKTAGGLRFRVGGNGGWVIRRQVTIPARPYLGASEQDRVEFREILTRYLAGDQS